jgi:FHA domain.
MQKLELAIFSQDHGWRNIISGLKDCGDEFNEFKFIALQKYMQYLNSRKTILKDLYTSKQAPAEEEDRLSGTASLDSTLFVSVRDLKQSARQIPRKATPVTRRLPKGEPVIIRLETGAEIEIKLSKHIYRISCVAGIELIDQEGQHYMLAKGRNMIGRDSDCDICLDTSLKDISRKHLIIDNLGDNRLKLTDLSSHGTSITQ